MAVIAKSPEWTPERDAKLVELWPTPLTNKQIASKLGGFTDFADGGRTAVSSRALKLGLPRKRNGARAKHKITDSYGLVPAEPYRPGIDKRPRFG